jgi:biotin carboxyl carrier protein
MGVNADPFAAAIDDARALMDALLAAGWREIHVVNGETELFIARDDGGPNPMRAVSAQPADEAPQARAAGAEHVVKAPHVATFVSVSPEGSWVEQGEALARLSVLDEEEDLAAPVSGYVGASSFASGDLIEFGDVVVTIEEEA